MEDKHIDSQEYITQQYMWRNYLDMAGDVRKDIQNLENKYQRLMLLAQAHHKLMLDLMGGVTTIPDVSGKDL
ncbi:MAG: hypothetical protein NVS1B10_08850 [Candidatus Saccharimonadales bacterium]